MSYQIIYFTKESSISIRHFIEYCNNLFYFTAESIEILLHFEENNNHTIIPFMTVIIN